MTIGVISMKGFYNMKEKELLEFMKNESLTFSEKAFDLLIEILTIENKIDNGNLDSTTKEVLYNKNEKLVKQFFKEFKKSNQKQLKKFQKNKDKQVNKD